MLNNLHSSLRRPVISLMANDGLQVRKLCLSSWLSPMNAVSWARSHVRNSSPLLHILRLLFHYHCLWPKPLQWSMPRCWHSDSFHNFDLNLPFKLYFSPTVVLPSGSPSNSLSKPYFRASLVAQCEESTCQCMRDGFDPWCRKIPHASEQLNPCTTNIELVL